MRPRRSSSADGEVRPRSPNIAGLGGMARVAWPRGHVHIGLATVARPRWHGHVVMSPLAWPRPPPFHFEVRKILEAPRPGNGTKAIRSSWNSYLYLHTFHPVFPRNPEPGSIIPKNWNTPSLFTPKSLGCNLKGFYLGDARMVISM